MKLYSYVVTNDTGFSPNPFWGVCTLADCKPVIRRTANVGDWIVGISPRDGGLGNKLIYAMQVSKILPYAQYFNSPEYECKKPSFDTGRIVEKCGDNIYKPLNNGKFQQLRSMHSKNPFTSAWAEDIKKKEKDLRGENVLIADKFYYFGCNPIDIPKGLEEIKEVGRGHKNSFSQETIEKFIEFISKQRMGVNAHPHKWSATDYSWRQQ